jgi:uncharacterized oligopeptide transporter (OPT) family protein
MELCGVASLPFAVGVYLPMSTSAPIFLGGLVRWLVDRFRSKSGQKTDEDDSGPGVLFSSGLIAGGSIAGIVLAIIAMSGAGLDLSHLAPAVSQSEIGAAVAFAAVMTMLFRVSRI